METEDEMKKEEEEILLKPKKKLPVKNIILYSVLAFSVIINLVVLITVLGFFRHNQRMHPPEMMPFMQDLGGIDKKDTPSPLNKEQRTKLKDLMDSFLKESEETRKKIGEKQKAIFEELKAENPDQAKIDPIIDEKAKLEADLDKLKMKHVIAASKILMPEQRAFIMQRLMQGMLGKGKIQNRLEDNRMNRPFLKRWLMNRQEKRDFNPMEKRWGRPNQRFMNHKNEMPQADKKDFGDPKKDTR
ncbi:MAG: periplasmic heavy metal sensor [Candidatus Coatesbacteria bacterium]|nr:periplasmic heavy metal sensor [Candidatus Coatesbacteria bacterium]